MAEVLDEEYPSSGSAGLKFTSAPKRQRSANLDGDDDAVEVEVISPNLDKSREQPTFSAPSDGESNSGTSPSLQSLFANKKADIAPASTEQKPKKRLFGFGSPKANSLKPKKPPVEKDATATKGWFSSVKKKPAKVEPVEQSAQFDTAGVTPGEAASSVAEPGAKRKAKPSKGSLHILVDIDSQTVGFNVTANGLQPAELTEIAVAASFTRDDKRFSVTAKTTQSQAEDIAISEGVGDEVRVVLQAKQFQAAYACDAERVAAASYRFGPGLKVLEGLLARMTRPQGAFALCLLLRDEESGRAVAVLHYVSADNEISEPQVTVNPHNLQFTLAQFQSARGLGSDSAVIQVTNEELVAAAGELVLYPIEAQYCGMPLTKLLWAGVAVCSAVSLAAGGYAATQRIELASLNSRINTQKAETVRYDKRNQELISSSLRSFAEIQSVDVSRVFSRAGTLWVPRSTLRVDASLGIEEYELTMTLAGNAYFNNRPSALAQIENQDVQQLLKLTPPEGCMKSMPGVSGGVNVIQLKVNCENPAGSSSRYRLD
jgi:hypothetical protein